MHVPALPNKRRLTFIAVAAAVMAAGAIGPGPAASAASAPAFAAVDLADAVLFSEGPAASYLAGFSRPSNVLTDPARRHRAAIDAAIKADARWAVSFADRLQSGDVSLVEAALRDLAVVARAQADLLFGADAVDWAIEQADRSNIAYVLTPPFEEHTLDLLVQHADAVVVAYVLVSSLTAEPGEPGQLLREQLVYEVATNLHTRR